MRSLIRIAMRNVTGRAVRHSGKDSKNDFNKDCPRSAVMFSGEDSNTDSYEGCPWEHCGAF